MKNFNDKCFDFGQFQMDAENKVLLYDGEIVSIPLKSVELLCLLIERRGEIVTKQDIFEKVWENSFVEDSVLSQNIYTLRKTFEEFGETNLIKTVPRRGYVFNYDKEVENSFTIEREVYEEIEIIEEVEVQRNLALPSNQTLKSKYLYPFFAVFVLFSTAFGYWFWLNKSDKKSLTQIKSIALLPIKTLTETENEKVLANGIREKIGSSLGNLKGIKILNTDTTESEIDKLITYDAVLLGTLQQSEDKIRVNLRLLQTKNSEQLWTGTFNELKADIFQLQDKISDEITKSLLLDLSKEDREIVFKRETNNKEAYEQYLQGRYFFNQRGMDYAGSLKKAKPFFEKAIELDPDFAEAYIGLADVINLKTDSGGNFDANYDEGYKKSKELISKALAIKPNLAEAYSAMGWIQYRYEWNFAEGEKNFMKAIELNPNLPNVYMWLSTIHTVRGNTEKAIFYAEKAVELEPAFSKAIENLVSTLAYNQKCEQAVELFPRFAQYMTNQAFRLELEGNILSICGRCEEAFSILLEAKKLSPTGRILAYNAGYCYAKTNQPEKAREELLVFDKAKFNGISLFGKIIIHNALGENEKAFELFNDLYKTKDPRTLRIFYEPRLKEFRNEPRYKEITKDLHLN